MLITGHTGFKGSWASLWLKELGATVTGYALPPSTRPSLFELARVGESVRSVHADIRDRASLAHVIATAQPEIVLHMAAQSLVRQSYRDPIETYEVNALGTAYLLEALRSSPSVRVVLVVTSDKCYENRETRTPYRESEPLGGHDPYASSKACAELIAAAYRASFYHVDGTAQVATARAGNVIGGGDWAQDRLVPDIVRAIQTRQAIKIRNPHAVRPWQHVLDPVSGYFLLAQRLWALAPDAATAWNFGPDLDGMKPVSWVVERVLASWGDGPGWVPQQENGPHEATLLLLDSGKAHAQLHWRPRLGLEDALDWTVEWYRSLHDGADARDLTVGQIRRYAARARDVVA